MPTGALTNPNGRSDLVTLPATRLSKPTLHTKFHIDYEWWDRESREMRVYLMSHLCPEHQPQFADYAGWELVDSVDPETAEVRRVDGLQHVLSTHCAQLPEFFTAHTPLMDAVFRVFIANPIQPLTPEELAERLVGVAMNTRKTASING